MVTFKEVNQLSLNNSKQLAVSEFGNSSKKRTYHDHQQQLLFSKRSKLDAPQSIFDIELHLDTPLPLDWQQCLDIQSGMLYFYNTRTNTRTSLDPRRNNQETSDHMNLDLELNLQSSSHERSVDTRSKYNKRNPARCPSWLAVEGDSHQEMVASVCSRCHMLVMMSKSSPACPNCKFIHPPDQSPPTIFNKRRLSLLC